MLCKISEMEFALLFKVFAKQNPATGLQTYRKVSVLDICLCIQNCGAKMTSLLYGKKWTTLMKLFFTKWIWIDKFFPLKNKTKAVYAGPAPLERFAVYNIVFTVIHQTQSKITCLCNNCRNVLNKLLNGGKGLKVVIVKITLFVMSVLLFKTKNWFFGKTWLNNMGKLWFACYRGRR